MRVRVEEQQESEAKVVRDLDGEMVLSVRPGLLSARAYVALGLALSALVEHRHQDLQSTG